MNTITVTVYQDNSGYHENGYAKSIPVAGLMVIGRETVQYGAAPECRTDPAQPSRTLLHISGPGINNLWVDETQASITNKVNGTCCDGGGASWAWALKTANATLSSTETAIKADATAGNISITLPSAASVSGKEFTIKKIDATANTVTIVGTIDGVANYVIGTQNVSISVVSDGTSYYIV